MFSDRFNEKCVLGLLIVALFVSGGTAATLELGSPFSEKMVLQRETAIPVWGWGESSKTVDVMLADHKASTSVGDDGTWKLELDAMCAGGPHSFRVTSGEETITYNDVLIGDVWICSGQSNMVMKYSGMIGKEQILDDLTDRPIRYMHVQTDVSFTPQPRCRREPWSNEPVSSAVALAFAYYLQKDTDIPVGIILTCWGSSSIEGWMPKDMTAELPHFARQMQLFEKNDREKVQSLMDMRDEGKKWPKKDNIYLRTRPNLLYNAMMHPLAPYAAQGIVWYQGEANTRTIEDMLQYRQSLQRWCKRMRRQWHHDDLNLLVVMLPKFARGIKLEEINDPAVHSWAWMRESQMKILELPHTGIANTIDLGDINNIHPPDKAPIGRRLALLARRNTCGKDLLAQGPKMKSVTIEPGKVEIRYDNADGLATVDGKPVRGFWVAGKDRQWKAVQGRIDGQMVVLECGEMTPEVVRYAFCAAPDVNLVNSAKIPALPFRTDTDPPLQKK